MKWQDAFTAPNAITLCNLLLGLLAMLSLVEGLLARSALFILAAVLVDAFDGLVARRLDKASAFGREFDSLADLVSFGVAPALLVHQAFFSDIASVGMVVSALYLSAGAARLARFNVASSSTAFSGLPVPAAGGLLAGITYPGAPLSGHVVGLIAVCLAALMVGSARYPKVSGRLSAPANRQLLAVLATGFLVALIDSRLLFVPFMAYILYGLARELFS